VKLRLFFTTGFILLSMIGWADVDVDTQDIGSEQIHEPAKRTPFSFNTYWDSIGSAKIERGHFRGDKVRFAVAEAEAGMVVYYCPAYTEGARIAVGYTATFLRWSENPWFNQDHFNNVNFTLAAFTKRLDRWFWRSQLTINVDDREWSAPFISYDILLWGRYTYNKVLGIHLGFLAQTGLRLDRVYPIIGFDWQISRKWKLNLVYPVNVSLIYSLTRHWSLAIAGRNFNSRFRVHRGEIFSKALVRYTNVGAEFMIKYEAHDMTANIHAGSTLSGGKFRVANHRNHRAHNYKLKPSGYVGAEMDVSF
jgi:hypothetical protein